jgi:hypothetical protein
MDEKELIALYARFISESNLYNKFRVWVGKEGYEIEEIETLVEKGE